MNYIRGAVNAISAPYQYYKDINPSTLTGAIDVIVIQRPGSGGENELVCSPFHVRFGKWQVLRPSDKKVDVSVNGQPIPYNMKIGEAGEAFFVFETDEDVPPDLVTSPILQPTMPEEEIPGARADIPVGRFGAKEDSSSNVANPNEGVPDVVLSDENPEHDPHYESQEPEFLDLDAGLEEPSFGGGQARPQPDINLTPKQEFHKPSFLRHSASRGTIQQRRRSVEVSPHSKLGLPSPPSSRSPTPEIYELDKRLDEALNILDEKPSPLPEYHHGLALDIEGYHSKIKGTSDPAIHSEKSRCSPVRNGPSQILPSKVPLRGTQSALHSTRNSSPSNSDSELEIHEPSNLHRLRATSEPPPELDDHIRPPIEAEFIYDRSDFTPSGSNTKPGHGVKLPPLPSSPSSLPEYSWEWGAFPTPSPMKSTFGKGGRLEGGIPWPNPHVEATEDIGELHHSRSKSEPPTPDQQESGVENSEDYSGSEKKPGSLSWTQWWNRSRQKDAERDRNVRGERPVLRPVASAPASARVATTVAPDPGLVLASSLTKDSSAKQVVALEQATTSTLPLASTPGEVPPPAEVQRPDDPLHPATEERKHRSRKKFAKTLRLTSDQLKALDLKPGSNSITFSVSSGVVACTARIFVWDYSDFVVISDIDGTITKSDGLGHVFAMIGRDWTHVGVAKLYTDIVKNGYKIMYLTSRAIGQADATRGYLKGIKQNDHQLPEGPVIMSPDRLMVSLHREVIMRKPELFKMACLRDIQRLFGEQAQNPFYAGFGNRITDALSYRSVNVPSAKIFTIDPSGDVKMELLELAGYKSSYIHMVDLVDQMFPPIHRRWSPEYTDFNYWKIPEPDYPLPDLAPPSPTLSARSDTSNLSTLAKLKSFRLMGSRANSISSSPPNKGISDFTYTKGDNDFRRSVSPSSASRSSYTADSDSESDIDGHFDTKKRPRRRSMTSMPGSLDDMDLGVDDYDDDHWDEEHGDGYEYEEEEGEDLDEAYDGEDEEMAMHEDLLAATEMKKIPFL